MLAGHYGVALALKRAEPGINLGALFVAAQWVDIVWAILVLAGVERVAVEPGITAASPLNFLYYPYTHSLAAAFAWSALAFLATRIVKGGNRTSLVMAAAVFSHFVLDLIAHRPDLPVASSSGPKLGLGLWYFPVAASIVESAIVVAGIRFYLRVPGARMGMVIFAVALLALTLFGQFAPPPPDSRTLAASALVIYFAAAAIAWRLDRRTV